MTTKSIDVHQPYIDLSELLALIAEGNEIVLTDGAKLLARIVPMDGNMPSAQQRIPDLFPGAIWTSEDFDEPLPDEFWLGTE